MSSYEKQHTHETLWATRVAQAPAEGLGILYCIIDSLHDILYTICYVLIKSISD
jgi:hypothetical protein